MKTLNPYILDEVSFWSTSKPDIDVDLTEHYGQKAEDLIIEALLRAAVKSGIVSWKEYQFVEIGGNHPIATSASYLIQKKYGLSGDIYEANPSLIEELVRVRKTSRVYNEAVCPQNLIIDGQVNIWVLPS